MQEYNFERMKRDLKMQQTENIIRLSEKDNIRDLQFAFSQLYPYLRIEFYKEDRTSPRGAYKKYLSGSLPLSAAGLSRGGDVLINDTMTVDELENELKKNFGLVMQALRKSGNVWLEINMSASWTLGRQNQQGRELSD